MGKIIAMFDDYIEDCLIMRSLATRVGFKPKGQAMMLCYYAIHQKMPMVAAVKEAIDWLEDSDNASLFLKFTNAEAWDGDFEETYNPAEFAKLWRQKMELFQERTEKREFVHRYLMPAVVEASDWHIREVLYTVRGEDEVVELYSDSEMMNLTRRVVVTCDNLATIMRDVAAVL